MLRTEPTADASLADMRARIKFGMGVTAMIRMMAPTISSSINEKPFCLRISIFPRFSSFEFILLTNDAVVHDICTCLAKAASYLGSEGHFRRALFSAEGQTSVLSSH